MMDCVLSGSLLVVFSLFCYAVFFFKEINSLSLSLSLYIYEVYSRTYCIHTLNRRSTNHTRLHQAQLLTSTVGILTRNASFTRICDCRMFRLMPHFSRISEKCAYRIFFPHKLAFSTAILIFYVFLFEAIFVVIRK